MVSLEFPVKRTSENAYIDSVNVNTLNVLHSIQTCVNSVNMEQNTFNTCIKYPINMIFRIHSFVVL